MNGNANIKRWSSHSSSQATSQTTLIFQEQQSSNLVQNFFLCTIKFPTILLASGLALISLSVAASTKSSTHSSTTLSKTLISSTKTATSSKTSSASTKTPSASCVATNYDINFDERIVNPVLAALNPVGIEDTIFFNSWAIIPQDNLTGVPAHSPPNAIVTAFEQQLTNGTPSLTVLYPGSKVKSFNLYSFFFGCTADTAATVADVPLQCTITLAGFRNGQEVTDATYTFSPETGLVEVPMMEAVLPKTFVNLQNVTIIQENPVVQVLVADNFNVTMCS